MNAVFHVARTLHDSLNSTSLQDERREITRLIQKFILKVRRSAAVEERSRSV